jgi:hypothetical protein
MKMKIIQWNNDPNSLWEKKKCWVVSSSLELKKITCKESLEINTFHFER